MPESLRDLTIRLLAVGAQEAMSLFDTGSGRFIQIPEELSPNTPTDAELGWAVVHQDVILALAYLWALRHADNPYLGDESVLEAVVRGGDVLAEFQNDDGSFEFIKSDGSRWGPMHLPWSTYHWLETYALVWKHLSAHRRQRWRLGLLKACEGVRVNLGRYGVHNISAWYAATLVRAAQIFELPELEAVGRRAVATIRDAQEEGGFWPEQGGPSPYYNLIYVHALGLYHAFTSDASVLPCLERAVEFHSLFSYPDSTSVETVDGRVGYRAYCPAAGLLAFSFSPKGRSLARRRLEAIESLGPSKAGLAQLTCAAMWLKEGEEVELPSALPTFSFRWRDKAAVRKEGPWFSVLSAWVAPATPNRWSLDRQSFASLWHADCGLLVGGGNSKNQSSLSTLSIDGCAEHIVPDSARLLDGNEGIALSYGDAICFLKIHIQGCRARFIAQASAPAEYRLSLRIKRGETVSLSNGLRFETSGERFSHVVGTRSEQIQIGRLKIEANRFHSIEWPVRPYNPYARDGFSPLDDARAVLSCTVAPDQDAVIELTVRPITS